MRTNGRSGAKPRAASAAGDGRRALRDVDHDRCRRRRRGRARAARTAVAASRATSGPSCVAVRPRARAGSPRRPGRAATTGAGRAARSARIAPRSAPKAARSSSAARARRRPAGRPASEPPLAAAAPAHSRVDGPEAHRGVDRRAGRRRVEHRHEPGLGERRRRALDEPRREAPPPVGLVHEHHAHPAEDGRVGEGERRGDDPAAVPHREAAAGAEHERPVGREPGSSRPPRRARARRRGRPRRARSIGASPRQKEPSRTSKPVGLASVGMPRASQSACQSTSVSSGTVGGPNSSSARLASLSSAVGASSPTIVARRAEVLGEGVGELADRRRLGAGHVERLGRRRAVAQAAQRDRVRVALPDHVGVAHRHVDGLAVAHLARRRRGARRSAGRSRSSAGRSGPAWRASRSTSAAPARGRCSSPRSRRAPAGAARPRVAPPEADGDERVDVAGREGDDAAVGHGLGDEAGEHRVGRPRARRRVAGAELVAGHHDHVRDARQAARSRRGRAGRRGSARCPAPRAPSATAGSLKRATAMMRLPGAARRAMRASVGPILPPTPSSMMSPSTRREVGLDLGRRSREPLLELRRRRGALRGSSRASSWGRESSHATDRLAWAPLPLRSSPPTCARRPARRRPR